MYPAAFDYHAPKNVKEALGLLGKLKDDAKILAGGHSLIPMMKLRLAQPKHLIDLGKVPGLSGIKADGKALVIGAMTTHWEVESSSAVKSLLPAGSGAAYMKFPHPASRFAVVGACAALTLDKQGVCSKAGVGVTGAGTRAVRAKGVEAALVGKRLDAATIEAAAQKAADGVDVQADLQGSVEYKSHLCRVFAKRAITEAVRRAGA